MIEFIKRNAPVFIIGGILALIFLVIISRGEADPTKILPDLIRVSQDDASAPSFGDDETGTTAPPISYTPPEPEKPRLTVLTEQQSDEEFGFVEIRYVKDTGFVPKNTSAMFGQLATWINDSDETITIRQIGDTSKEWGAKEFTLEPGQSFDFRLLDSFSWTFSEVTTKNFGTIYVRNLYR